MIPVPQVPHLVQHQQLHGAEEVSIETALAQLRLALNNPNFVMDINMLKELGKYPARALRVWKALHSLPSSSASLLLDHMENTHAPANECTAKNWNTSWNYYTQLIRWVAALAVLEGCTTEEAAETIHAAEPRWYTDENGQRVCYGFERFKRANYASRLAGSLKEAWEISGERGEARRRDHLQLKAMGCNIDVQM